MRFWRPAYQAKYRGQSEEIALRVVSPQEENPEPGREAICWRLLSTLPMEDAAGVIAQVQRYSQRWPVELFHKILKSGCRIEEQQLEIAERIGLWLGNINRIIPQAGWTGPLFTIHRLAEPPVSARRSSSHAIAPDAKFGLSTLNATFSNYYKPRTLELHNRTVGCLS